VSASSAERALFAFVVTHPVTMVMMFVAAVVFGSVSYQRLPLELMPELSYPTITVRTTYEGAAPQEVETQVSRLVEESLSTLDGLVSLESRSRAGVSDVVLGFDWGTDMSGAVQAVRENLQTTFLPEEAERPLILRYDPSLDPFLRLALSVDAEKLGGPNALFLLRRVADGEFRRELEALPGIAAVRIRGGLEREVRVTLREDWMAARQVSIDQVWASLAAENVNMAGGSVYEGDTEYLVRTLNEYTTPADVESLKIRRADGVLIPLADLAVIDDGWRDREVIARLDAGEAVEIELFKEADANLVDVARKVKAAIEPTMVPVMDDDGNWTGEVKPEGGLAGALPDGVRLDIVENQATFIEEALDNLRDAAVQGGFLSIIVLFLFLRDFRATGIVGLVIPLSVVLGFAPLYLLGVTLNLMSLGGLALGIGMLVDNAIVVLESIQQQREAGLDRRQAAIAGAADVALAVTASNFSSVAVFAPIGFVEGVAGELFGDLSWAVVCSQTAGLVVALFLVPVLASVELDPAGFSLQGSWLRWISTTETLGFFPRIKGLALEMVVPAWDGLREDLQALRARPLRAPLLLWQLPRALATLLFGLTVIPSVAVTVLTFRALVFLGGWALWPPAALAWGLATAFQFVYLRAGQAYSTSLRAVLGVGGIPVLGIAVATFVCAGFMVPGLGSELLPEVHQGRFTIEVALPVGTPLKATEKVVAELERVVANDPEVEVVYAQIGADPRADARSEEGEHTARLRVTMTDGGDTAAREEALMARLRDEVADVGAGVVKFSRPSLFSVRTPMEVVIYGYELDGLQASGERVAEQMAAIPGLQDVKSSQVAGFPEVRVVYDREKLHRLGLDPGTVAERIRDKVQGRVATQLRQGDQRVELKVQLVEADRGSLDQLRRININPQLYPPIPLESVAEISEGVGPSEIRRVDQQRAVVVSANLAGFDLGSAGSALAGVLDDVSLPEGFHAEVGGQFEEMNESLGSMGFAVALAVFLVYVIMASTFEHLIHPLIVLFSVPLALVGAVVALKITGTPVSVVVLIGAIVLVGVVVNNAIVLIDTVNRLRDEGHPVVEALTSGGAERLRPILITSFTAVLGLVPLALGIGAGAEIQQPLAVTVMGGLSSSTLLTLYVVPILYNALSRDRVPEQPPVVAPQEAPA
jgi:HAE1 family hydrophobic/amphiphilic exporter-1